MFDTDKYYKLMEDLMRNRMLLQKVSEQCDIYELEEERLECEIESLEDELHTLITDYEKECGKYGKDE